MEQVPFFDLKIQYKELRHSIESAMNEVIETASFILGPEVEQFETAFADYLGIDHAIGVGNGTDAITLALKAAGIQAGDEVLVPANTFIATPIAVTSAGAVPVPVDIDEDSFLINLEMAQKRCTKKTKAIIPVHLYGMAVDMDSIKQFAETNNLIVIEDASQAHGAYWNERRVGNFGIASCFSFYPSKNLGAYGDGGMVVTNDTNIADKVRALRNYGSQEKYIHEIAGTNSRLDSLQAAVLNVKLQHLDRWNKRRIKMAKKYNEGLSGIDGLVLPVIHENHPERHVFHLYVVRHHDRDKMTSLLNKNNIQFGIHYPIPFHLQNAYKNLGFGPGSCPVTESLVDNILSLPLFPEMTDHQIGMVVDCVREINN